MIIRVEGGIHDNPASGHLQRHRHTDTINAILTTIGRLGKEKLSIWQVKWLYYRPASKHNATGKNSLLNSGLPSEGQPLTSIVLLLNLPKFHLSPLYK